MTPTRVEQKYLQAMAEFSEGVTAPQLAVHLNANTITVGSRLSTMHARGIVSRRPATPGPGYLYFVKSGVQAEKKIVARETPHEPVTVSGSFPTSVDIDLQAQPQPPVDQLGAAVSKFAEDLAHQVAERMKPILMESLRGEVTAMAAQIVNEVANSAVGKTTGAPQKPEVALPTVFIGGAIPDMVSRMKKEFEGVADLRFAGADESLHKWKSMAVGATHTVLATDFISHKHTEAVTSTGVKPHLVKGGVSSLINEVMRLCI